MRAMVSIFCAIGVGTVLSKTYEFGKKVGEFQGTVKEVKKIHKDLCTKFKEDRD